MIGRQRQADGEDAAAERGRGVRGGGEDLVGVGEVVEEGDEAEFDADSEGEAGEGGDDPVDIWSGCPALQV